MRTRHSIHDTPSHGVMIACFLVDEVQRNVDVVDVALNQELVLTPSTVPNPAYGALLVTRRRLDEHLALIETEITSTAATLPNPDRLALEDRIFEKAEAALDAPIPEPEVIPVPGPTPKPGQVRKAPKKRAGRAR